MIFKSHLSLAVFHEMINCNGKGSEETLNHQYITDLPYGRIYDKNPTRLDHIFVFMGVTFKEKMNQSVTKTREPNVWGSYRISDDVLILQI